jgi:hypothetical protein
MYKNVLKSDVGWGIKREVYPWITEKDTAMRERHALRRFVERILILFPMNGGQGLKHTKHGRAGGSNEIDLKKRPWPGPGAYLGHLEPCETQGSGV